MQYEVEQKFRCHSPAGLQAAIERLGATLGPPVEQVDHYLNHPARDFAHSDEALRVRCVGRTNRLTYKGPKVDATTKTRREIELELAPGADAAAAWMELLIALGFHYVAKVHKLRRTGVVLWQEHEVEVAYDEVDGVGNYCELELQADEQHIEEAKSGIASLAAALGLIENERRSYLELLLEMQNAE